MSKNPEKRKAKRALRENDKQNPLTKIDPHQIRDATPDAFTHDEWVDIHFQSARALEKLGIITPEVSEHARVTIKVAERNLVLSISTLALVLTRILDAYQHSKTHIKSKQASQLLNSIEIIGKYETGGRLDGQLDLTIAHAQWNVDFVAQVYEVLGQARTAEDIKNFSGYLDEGREAVQIASDFRDGVKNLLDKTDNGESLIKAIDTYQGDIQRWRGDAMKAAAPDYGGRPSVKDDLLTVDALALRNTTPQPSYAKIANHLRGKYKSELKTTTDEKRQKELTDALKDLEVKNPGEMLRLRMYRV